MKKALSVLLPLALLAACGGKNNSSQTTPPDSVAVPVFQADTAMAYVEKQCSFGPRVMNSEAHRLCGDYLVAAFRACGLEVSEQKADIAAYDGTTYHLRNIMARFDAQNPARVLICAHWDSRPWADADPDPANHRKPLLGANDGASGVAVMLEVARHLRTHRPAVGIDFVCFDAEDAGAPEWDDVDETTAQNSWCLGSQYFAANLPTPNYSPRYGVLLDMVGGRGARFYREGFSQQYASMVIDKMWAAAARAGFGSRFVNQAGGYVTDDHGPLNSLARIPTIDVIPYYGEAGGSGFGPTWHTLADTPANIDPATLRAVGQSLMQLIYEEQV